MRRGARWCWLDLAGHDLSGLIEEFPFLPADATAVRLVVHSNSYRLIPCDEDGHLLEGMPDAEDQAQEIRASDRAWPDSPEAGPDCRCSRCRRPIVDQLPVRFPCGAGTHEYRFHGQCLGLRDPPELGAA